MFIFIDLEMNQWSVRQANVLNSEIIEIGAIKMNSRYEIVDTFCRLVRPQIESTLSEHIKALTKISQAEIDTASVYSEVMREFENWVGKEQQLNAIYVWGNYDTYQVTKENYTKNYLGISREWFEKKTIDFQKVFESEFSFQHNTVGLKKALELFGLSFAGQNHRAKDDAMNLALLFKEFQNNKEKVEEVREIYQQSNILENERRKKRKIIKSLQKDIIKAISKFDEDQIDEIKDVLIILSEQVKLLEKRKKLETLEK